MRCMGLECRKGALQGCKRGAAEPAKAGTFRRNLPGQPSSCIRLHSRSSPATRCSNPSAQQAAITSSRTHMPTDIFGLRGSPTLSLLATHLNPTMESSRIPTHCASLVRAVAMRSRIVSWSKPARVAPLSVKSATSKPAPYSLLTSVHTAERGGESCEKG